MKRIHTPALILFIFSLWSTHMNAQLKASFTIKSDTICRSVAAVFTSTATGGTKPYKSLWQFGDGDTSTAANPTHYYASSGVYKVTHYILDAIFDTNSVSKSITVVALPNPNAGGTKRGCWGHGVLLTTGLPHMPVVNWTWILGKDTVRNTFKGDSIVVNDSGSYAVKVQNSFGCIGFDTVNVFFNPMVKVKSMDTTVCYGDSVILSSGSSKATWIDPIHGNKIISTSATFGFRAIGKTGYGTSAKFGFIISQTGHGVTCTDTGFINVTVNTPSHPVLSPLASKCINSPAFLLSGSDSSHKNGTWYYPKKPSAVVNNYLYPSIMGETDNNPALGYIHYLYVNQYGCITDDSVRIKISALPKVYAGPDTIICKHNGKYLLSNAFVNPAGGVWFPLNGTPQTAILFSTNHDSVFFDPMATGVADTVYGVIYTYKAPLSCSNSDTVYIKVTDIANAHWTMNYLGNKAFFHAIDSGLYAGAYQWKFGDGNTAIGHSVVHQYASNKSYAVSLQIAVAGTCTSSYDSTVNIIRSGIAANQSANFSVDIFPNPFYASAWIQYTINKYARVNIGLYDITGKQVSRILDKYQEPGNYQENIDAAKLGLPPGVYILKLMTEDGFVSRQIIKL